MATVKVTLSPGWPAKEFVPGGGANRYVNQRAIRAVELANAMTPSRGGNLRRHNKKTGTLNRGPYRAEVSVYNDAPYAAAVHEGTLGKRIRPKNSDAMPIPVVPGLPRNLVVKNFPVGPNFRKKFVKGQRSQPWLQRACDIAFGA